MRWDDKLLAVGNDTLNGGDGDDILLGGSGTDTATFSSNSSQVNLNLTRIQNTGDGNDILISIERVVSGDGDDTVVGRFFK